VGARRPRVPEIRRRRAERKDGSAVSAHDQAQMRQNDVFFVDRIQVSSALRLRQGKGDEEPAPREYGSEVYAFRRQAHVLRRFQDPRRRLSARGQCSIITAKHLALVSTSRWRRER
jgi:hypothetical protein